MIISASGESFYVMYDERERLVRNEERALDLEFTRH